MSIPRLYFSSLASPYFLTWSHTGCKLPISLDHDHDQDFIQPRWNFDNCSDKVGKARPLGEHVDCPPRSLRWHKSIQIRSTPGTQPKRAQHTRRTNKQLQQNELTTPLHLDNSEKKPAFHPEVHLCSVHFRQLASVNYYYRKSSCNW